MGSGELFGVPGSSREVSGRALGAPEGSFWVQFGPSGEGLGPLFGKFDAPGVFGASQRVDF